MLVKVVVPETKIVPVPVSVEVPEKVPVEVLVTVLVAVGDNVGAEVTFITGVMVGSEVELFFDFDDFDPFFADFGPLVPFGPFFADFGPLVPFAPF